MRTLAGVLKNEIKRVAREAAERALKRVRRLQRQTKALRLLVSKQRLAVERLDRRTRKLRSALLAARGFRPSAHDATAQLSPREIYDLRSQLGLTRVQFAARLGVSPGSIFGWEHGRTAPRGSNIARLQELNRARGTRAATRKSATRKVKPSSDAKKKTVVRRRRAARR